MVAAAVEFDGGDGLRLDALVVAGLCGVLGGLLEWRESGATDDELARDVDVRLEQRGALRTALEVERRADSPFAALLSIRASRSLPVDALSRAAPWPSLAWLAAPLFALGVWLLAAQASAPRHPELVALAARAQSALSAGAAAPDALEAAAHVEQLAGDARVTDEALREPVRRLAEELERTLAAPSLAARNRIELAATRAELERAAARLEIGKELLDSSPGRSREGPGETAIAQRTLQNQAGDRTMTGSPSDAPPSNSSSEVRRPVDSNTPVAPEIGGGGLASTPFAPRDEAGVSTGRWWPHEHDAVVSAWRGRRP